VGGGVGCGGLVWGGWGFGGGVSTFVKHPTSLFSSDDKP